MANFDENVDVMGEWVPRSPSHRTIFSSAMREEKNSNSNSNSNSNRVLERELSLNHGQMIGLQEIRNKEKQSIRGGLSERRAGFNAPRLNTENIRSTEFSLESTVRSPCLTISSPGLSPATLLESPVFLSNPLAHPSPTTGKFPFLPGVNNNQLSSSALDKPKDEFFDDIGLSFTFHPISGPSSSFFHGTTTSKVALSNQHSFPGTEVSIDYSNYNRPSNSMEDVKPGSQNIEIESLQASFHETEGDLSGQRVSDATNISLEPVEPQEEEQRRGGVCAGDLLAGGAPAEDGYNWRKYGQKLVKGSEYPRSYYKCTHPNCQVKKKVERSREGHITEIIYKGAHNHSKPPPNRRSGIGSSGACLDTQVDGSEHGEQQSGLGRDLAWTNSTQQAGSNENIEGASPVSTGFEYGNHQSGSMQGQIGVQFEPGDAAFGSVSASASAAVVVDGSPTFSNDEDEDDRGTHGSVSLGYDGEVDESESKRRKLEAYATEMSGATRAIREPRVVVQTTSDVDILEDGYRWRKYGQKVVKGNPNPRSYYKCTAPGCTVRKHVERASHDLKSVITTYEGKHNHDVPAARNSGSNASGNGNSGGGSVGQTHYNHHHSEPQRSRFDRAVTTTNHHTSPYGPFSFQPHLGPPGFSFGLGQTGLGNLSMPGLAFGQGKLPVIPVHPYLTQQQQQQHPQQAGIGETQGMMMQRGMEPKVEPVSETGLGLSSSSSIYKQLMNRLPQI